MIEQYLGVIVFFLGLSVGLSVWELVISAGCAARNKKVFNQHALLYDLHREQGKRWIINTLDKTHPDAIEDRKRLVLLFGRFMDADKEG